MTNIQETFLHVSIGLVTKYAEYPEKLSADQRAQVEEWMETIPHVKDEVEEIRNNLPFYRTLTTSLSHD